jgi:hypothetical protein
MIFFPRPGFVLPVHVRKSVTHLELDRLGSAAPHKPAGDGAREFRISLPGRTTARRNRTAIERKIGAGGLRQIGTAAADAASFSDLDCGQARHTSIGLRHQWKGHQAFNEASANAVQPAYMRAFFRPVEAWARRCDHRHNLNAPPWSVQS